MESTPGQGTQFILSVPLTLATTRAILVEQSGQTFAIPSATVERTARVREGDRLRVRVRVFEGTIDTEVRVMSTRGGDTAGTIVAGCAFLDPSPHASDIVGRLLDRLNAPAAAPQREVGVRAALGIGAEAETASEPAPRVAPTPVRRPGIA